MPESERKCRPRWKKAIFYSAILFVMYWLSIGPAIWIECNVFNFVPGQGGIATEVFHIVYSPLFWLCDGSDLFHRLTAWYFSLWSPEWMII